MFRKVRIKIHGNIILYLVLYGCETWSVTLVEERRPGVLWGTVGPKRSEKWEVGENCIMRGLIINVISMAKMRRACSTHGIVDV
jgi:hypothetical protein